MAATRPLFAPVVAIALLQVASPGLARDDNYGAIAISASTGRYGFSYDYDSRLQAEKEARSNCGVSDCRIKVWFKNNCGAYARGRDGDGWAYDDRRGDAEHRALSECHRRTSGCSIVCWACNSH